MGKGKPYPYKNMNKKCRGNPLRLPIININKKKGTSPISFISINVNQILIVNVFALG
jgi:hypothetical protein